MVRSLREWHGRGCAVLRILAGVSVACFECNDYARGQRDQVAHRPLEAPSARGPTHPGVRAGRRGSGVHGVERLAGPLASDGLEAGKLLLRR